MRVHIPGALRKWTGGRDVIDISDHSKTHITTAEVIEALAREHPGVRDRILNEQGELRRHVNIFIDGENARFLGGLSAKVGPDSEIWIHPSLSGGAKVISLHGQTNVSGDDSDS
jgi:sulfur-carrier protein